MANNAWNLSASGHLVQSGTIHASELSVDMDALAEKVYQKFGPEREKAFRDACVAMEVAGEDYIKNAPEGIRTELEVFLRTLIRDVHIHADTEKKIMEAK